MNMERIIKYTPCEIYNEIGKKKILNKDMKESILYYVREYEIKKDSIKNTNKKLRCKDIEIWNLILQSHKLEHENELLSEKLENSLLTISKLTNLLDCCENSLSNLRTQNNLLKNVCLNLFLLPTNKVCDNNDESIKNIKMNKKRKFEN